jgi:hypothetical protein
MNMYIHVFMNMYMNMNMYIHVFMNMNMLLLLLYLTHAEQLCCNISVLPKGLRLK